MRAFTLIEVILSILILGVLFILAIKSMAHVRYLNQVSEIRYLALNKLESEMNRLVYFYKEAFIDLNKSSDNIDSYFDFDKSYRSYTNENILLLNGDSSGLALKNNQNIVEIKNIDTLNEIRERDIVGILGWLRESNGSDFNISLSISYPYRYKDLTPLWDFNETINLKTSVRR